MRVPGANGARGRSSRSRTCAGNRRGRSRWRSRRDRGRRPRSRRGSAGPVAHDTRHRSRGPACRARLCEGRISRPSGIASGCRYGRSASRLENTARLRSLTRPASISAAISSIASSVRELRHRSRARDARALERDAVVAGVLKREVDPVDLARRRSGRRSARRRAMIVEFSRAEVVDAAASAGQVRDDRGGDVAHVQQRPVLLAAEDRKLTDQLRPHDQQVDDQVEADPRVGVADARPASRAAGSGSPAAGP